MDKSIVNLITDEGNYFQSSAMLKFSWLLSSATVLELAKDFDTDLVKRLVNKIGSLCEELGHHVGQPQLIQRLKIYLTYESLNLARTIYHSRELIPFLRNCLTYEISKDARDELQREISEILGNSQKVDYNHEALLLDFDRLEKSTKVGIMEEFDLLISYSFTVLLKKERYRMLVKRILDEIKGMRYTLAYNRGTESISGLLDKILVHQSLKLARIVFVGSDLIAYFQDVLQYESHEAVRKYLLVEMQKIE